MQHKHIFLDKQRLLNVKFSKFFISSKPNLIHILTKIYCLLFLIQMQLKEKQTKSIYIYKLTVKAVYTLSTILFFIFTYFICLFLFLI